MVLLVLLVAGPVWAQVRCLSSFPAPDSRLEAGPRSVILWMSEPVDLQFSRFQVTDPYGRRFDGPPQVSPDGLRVEIPLRPLPDGTFLVHYRAASVLNGHVTVGFFRFAVRAPAAASETSPAVVGLLRALGGAFTLGAVAWGSAGAAAAATAAAAAEWVHVASAQVPAPWPALATSGWLGLLLAGTQPGWALLLAAAATAAWALPGRPPRGLLRTAAAGWLFLAVPVVAAAGGPLSLLASSHGPALLLTLAAYGVAALLAVLALPVLGVRVEEPEWNRLLLGLLLAASWALRPARTVHEFFALWAVLSVGCAVAYLWGARKAQGRA